MKSTFRKENLALMKIYFILLILIPFSFSCSKQLNLTKAPFSTAFFLSNKFYAGYIDTSTSNLEIGYLFSVTKNGKITSLMSFMPKAGSYKVTIWDATSQAKLVQADITQQNDGENVSMQIDPVSAVSGKNYLLSVTIKPRSSYVFTTGNGSPISYPIPSGHITILGYREERNTTNAAIYPTKEVNDHALGLVDLMFHAD